MHIAFIHTPMPLIRIAEMESYWQAFDIQYHAAHPGLRHMERVLWELPHWIPWLGGVLDAHGFESLCVIDFYTQGTPFDGIDRASAAATLLASPADVYLFSPMTPNLSFALEIADEVKRLFPESVTVFGGVVATPLYGEVAAHPSVDYVVMDRGESALLELLSALQGTRSPETVGNLAYQLPGGEVATGSRRSANMLARDIPFPRIDCFQGPPGTTSGTFARCTRWAAPTGVTSARSRQ